MIYLIDGQYSGHETMLENMYRLRARAFGERRNWKVKVENGQEKDKFDDLHPLYAICTDDEKNVLGSLRLLPTTGPYMLSEVFSEIMADESIVRNPRVWECSRFCVDTQKAGHNSANINSVTRELLFGAHLAARYSGVEFIISVYDLYVERILRRSGCEFDRIGKIVRYDDLPTVAGLFEVTDDIIEDLKRKSSGSEVYMREKILSTSVFPKMSKPLTKSSRAIDRIAATLCHLRNIALRYGATHLVQLLDDATLEAYKEACYSNNK